LRELGDRRHLAQQPQAVEPPLLDRARRPCELRGPADLTFDLSNEPSDLVGSGLGLHAQTAAKQNPHPVVRLLRSRRSGQAAALPSSAMNTRLRMFDLCAV
jgi:hypothetical protein